MIQNSKQNLTHITKTLRFAWNSNFKTTNSKQCAFPTVRHGFSPALRNTISRNESPQTFILANLLHFVGYVPISPLPNLAANAKCMRTALCRSILLFGRPCQIIASRLAVDQISYWQRDDLLKREIEHVDIDSANALCNCTVCSNTRRKKTLNTSDSIISANVVGKWMRVATWCGTWVSSHLDGTHVVLLGLSSFLNVWFWIFLNASPRTRKTI